MNSHKDADFRLRLSRGFFAEAECDWQTERWASCVEHAQLAVENAAKAVLACRGPVQQTHEPQGHLRTLLSRTPELPAPVRSSIENIIQCNDRLGFREHILASYGDEQTRRTPQEIFDREAADASLETARQALDSAVLAFEHFCG